MAFNFENIDIAFNHLLGFDWKHAQFIKDETLTDSKDETLLSVELKDVSFDYLAMFGFMNKHFGYNFKHRHSVDYGEVMTISTKQREKRGEVQSLASAAFIKGIDHLKQDNQDIDLISNGLAFNAWLQHIYKRNKVLGNWGQWSLKFEDDGFQCKKEASHIKEVDFFKSAQHVIQTQATQCGSNVQATTVSSDRFPSAGFLRIKAKPYDLESVFGSVSDELCFGLDALIKTDKTLQLNMFE